MRRLGKVLVIGFIFFLLLFIGNGFVYARVNGFTTHFRSPPKKLRRGLQKTRSKFIESGSRSLQSKLHMLMEKISAIALGQSPPTYEAVNYIGDVGGSLGSYTKYEKVQNNTSNQKPVVSHPTSGVTNVCFGPLCGASPFSIPSNELQSEISKINQRLTEIEDELRSKSQNDTEIPTSTIQSQNNPTYETLVQTVVNGMNERAKIQATAYKGTDNLPKDNLNYIDYTLKRLERIRERMKELGIE